MITIPECIYSSVIDLKAKRFIENHFPNSQLINEANNNIAVKASLKIRIEIALNDFQTKTNKTAFLTIILSHFSFLLRQIDEGTFTGSNNLEVIHNTKPFIEEIIFEILQHLEIIGVEISSEAFTASEFTNISNILSKILEELDIVKAGNVILGEQIEELQNDIIEIKSSMVLGKKSFTQRMTGVVTTYVATKGADEAFMAIKPHFTELMHGGFDAVIKYLDNG